MKKIFITILLIGIILIPGISLKSEIKPYYSGEVINYNDEIYIGSTNSGYFELFKSINGVIVKISSIRSSDENYNYFFDFQFSEENGSLYVYLVNGLYLSKYNITYSGDFRISKKVKHNSGDEFFGVSTNNDKIITIGIQGIKTWNKDLINIDSYKEYIDFPENLTSTENGNYFFEIIGDKFYVLDAFYHNFIFDQTLYSNEYHGRNVYYDNITGGIYLVDDSRMQKYSLGSGLVAEFKHISDFGYDVDGIDDSRFVYFSDGVGVVKSSKDNLEPIDWVYTTDLGEANGWAMGLRVVKNRGEEFVVVFNGSSILLLNEDLDLVDSYGANEFDFSYSEPLYEPMYLSLNRNFGYPDDIINIQGGGFGPNEEIEIKILESKYYARTDALGRFSSKITVPFYKQGTTDIKTIGKISGLTYSTSFKIY